MEIFVALAVLASLAVSHLVYNEGTKNDSPEAGLVSGVILGVSFTLLMWFLFG